jgi:3-dehydro-L-gulonate 2-dehydrogenase
MEELGVPFEDLVAALTSCLIKNGFEQDRAVRCATLFAQADLDGVYSHGVNRFWRFIEYVESNYVDPKAIPTKLSQIHIFERWNGNFGAGNLNAEFAMDRAIALSNEFGIGCVALQNTNHWMRAGNYGWQAVAQNCIGICFTNTKANMPAWGGSEPKLGNNPLVIAIPRANGPVVLDMAMSQFAYGKMTLAQEQGEMMPFEAGFDENGNLTKDPISILKNEMALPTGLWKGSGLALILDLLAAILSGGQSVHEIQSGVQESGLSQVFIAIDPNKLELMDWMETKADSILEDLKGSATFPGESVRYPGEQVLAIRNENMKKGIPISLDFWNKLKTEINE